MSPFVRKAAWLLPLVLATSLAGCKDKEKAPQAEAAEGAKLLPRSISDDMPAYDTVRSKAPLAEPELAEKAATHTAPSPAASEPDESAESGENEAPAPNTTAPAPTASPAATPDEG